MIHVSSLEKTYRIFEKEPGLLGSVRSLFHRKWIDRHALKPISFEIGSGEILGLLGANGAGKTTLIKLLAGIMHPTSGNASIHGYTPWERKTAFKQEIALILGQKSQLWPDLPAGDSLLLLQEIYRIPEALFQKRLSYFLETLDLAKLLKTQIRRLSLGERMKFELVAALLHQPKVIFLDEPTIGLDIGSQRAMRNFLSEYRKEFKPAMILTSHYMEDVQALCERLLILREGEQVFTGKLSEITERYGQHRTIRLMVEETGLLRTLQNEFATARLDPEDPSVLRIPVGREDLSPSILRILQIAPRIDLAIEEEDLGSIIDALQTRKNAEGPRV